METVDHFKYLGDIICVVDSTSEVLCRAAHTMAALARIKTIWKDKNIRIKCKIRLTRALVITILLYDVRFGQSHQSYRQESRR